MRTIYLIIISIVFLFACSKTQFIEKKYNVLKDRDFSIFANWSIYPREGNKKDVYYFSHYYNDSINPSNILKVSFGVEKNNIYITSDNRLILDSVLGKSFYGRDSLQIYLENLVGAFFLLNIKSLNSYVNYKLIKIEFWEREDIFFIHNIDSVMVWKSKEDLIKLDNSWYYVTS